MERDMGVVLYVDKERKYGVGVLSGVKIGVGVEE